MTKLADATFSAGGSEYSFTAYSADTSFNDVSAVYIFTKRTVKDGKGSHSFLYIGETGELGTRISSHEKWGCVNSHGCNCICVHRIDGDRARSDIETAFRNAHNTPCNDQ
ncbi:MAG: hypothetical protein OXG82_01480 [Gammaproteobacteria bacterium]|nr:hypothetical protein [Gammaproteobacteria bacterium]